MNSISVQDFALQMNNADVVILDTRDHGAFEENHLPQAVSMPATSLPNRLSELDKDKTYFILSHSGRRSEILANFLTDNGFNAVHVIGGMRAYRHVAATVA